MSIGEKSDRKDWQLSKSTLALVISSIILFLFAVGAGIFAFNIFRCENDPDEKNKIRIEFVKAILQFSVLVIIGTSVTAPYTFINESVKAERTKKENEAEQERLRREKIAERERLRREKKAEQNLRERERIAEQNQLRAEIRADYLKRLGVLYRKAKAARRSLRAAGLTRKHKNIPNTLSEAQANAYKKEMRLLNHVQLELEALKIEAECLPDFASINGLSEDLRSMEDYLREILKEYEKKSPVLDSGKSICFEKDLDWLDDFTDTSKRENGIFKKKFLERYDNAIKVISKSLE